MTCLANEPKCGGELIEKLRYWSLQSAMMDKILGACKDMDYTALKSIVQQSGLSPGTWRSQLRVQLSLLRSIQRRPLFTQYPYLKLSC